VHVFAFNVDTKLADALTFKAKTHVTSLCIAIKYMEAAIDPKRCMGEFFISFDGCISIQKIKAQFELRGARSVSVVSFARYDNDESASAALASVRKLAAKPASVSYIRPGGSLQESINKRANEKLMPRIKTIANANRNPSEEADDIEEYDVVKKRRLMDTAPDTEEECPYAKAQFLDFESAVKDALVKVHVLDVQDLKAELMELEELDDEEAFSATGGVYIARCSALPGIVKIGATRRPTPQPRLKELSKGVPTPFGLVLWIPTKKPFKLEAFIHKYFDAIRIKEPGAGTEFFLTNMSESDIQMLMEYIDQSVYRPT
jgi:ribosomal protein L31E